jgi:FixJ family two-component response regulator
MSSLKMTGSPCPMAHVILREESERDAFAAMLRAAGLTVAPYASAEEFIDAWQPGGQGSLILDIRIDDADAYIVQQNLTSAAIQIPIILIAGQAGVTSAVRRIKALAVDFQVTPINMATLVESVVIAVHEDAVRCRRDRHVEALRARYETLTRRERQVLSLVCDGLMNKQIAAELGISVITVKLHRSSVMRKMCCTRLVELVRAIDAIGVLTRAVQAADSYGSTAAAFA